MKIQKITIKNFKGINKLTLDLNREPITKIFTLVGLNESGKTSILEALDILENDKPKALRHELIPKAKKMAFNGIIEVQVEYIWEDSDRESIQTYIEQKDYVWIKPIHKHSISRRYKFNDSEPTDDPTYIWDIPLSVTKNRNKTNYHNLQAEEWKETVKHIKTYLKPKIIYYPNFLFDFPEKIYLNQGAVSTVEDRKYLAIIQDILSYIKPDLTIEKHLLERMNKSERSSIDSLESTLGKMSYTVTKVVFNAWERIFSKGNKEIVITYGSEIPPPQKLISISPDTGKMVTTIDTLTPKKNYYLQFRVKEGPDKFNLNERSLGFKWFFSFLLFTEFRKIRRSDYGGILFLLDEPASNLHSTAQSKLLTTFNELVNKSTLIYTTHSHHMINPAWLSGAYIVKNNAIDYRDGFSFLPKDTDIQAIPYRQFVATNPNQEDYFQPILDALEYQPGSLEKIPDILITEGKNDYYTLKYLNKVYLQNQFEDINIFPGTGADTNRPIMALYLAWGRNFLLMLDADKKGVQAKKSYIDDLGHDVKDKIITLADVDKTWVEATTENLFTEDELLAITKKFDSKSVKYEKSKFNTALQTLLYHEEQVELSEKTINNFEKLFIEIRSRLNK